MTALSPGFQVQMYLHSQILSERILQANTANFLKNLFSSTEHLHYTEQEYMKNSTSAVSLPWQALMLQF